jgi:C4-dicarboxylate transporter DctM subunit
VLPLPVFTRNAGIGMVHPPVDLNLFMLPSTGSAPMGEAIRGILPFLVSPATRSSRCHFRQALMPWLPDAILGQ